MRVSAYREVCVHARAVRPNSRASVQAAVDDVGTLAMGVPTMLTLTLDMHIKRLSEVDNLSSPYFLPYLIIRQADLTL